jgi:tetraacyldisaccharide 4'-kinase
MRAPEFWTGQNTSAKACAALLAPLGALYGLSVRLRQAGARPLRPKARILCVGNLTAGGSGKTPVAIALGRMLRTRGKKIVFLSRGYGGRLRGPVRVDLVRHSFGDVGDEALLLAAQGAVIVARARAAGARLADSLGADVIIMDDGFQNFQIAKDLSLVVVDAAAGFGNGRLIPAGPLREPVAQGLARADAIVLMGEGLPKLPGFAGPMLRAHILPTAPDVLSGRMVFAFAGIGRPEKFFQMLRAIGARIVAAQAFPDHHRFAHFELTAMKTAAETAGALLVTTEKDFARLGPLARKNILPVPVHAVFDDSAALALLLDRLGEVHDVAKP